MRQPVLDYARLTGELVVLRPACRHDAEEAFPLIHRQRPILDWLVWQGPADVEELRENLGHWATASDAGGNYRFALEEKVSGRFCGTIGLRFVDHPFVGDVGYWIGERFWGRGLATEANFLVAHLAFRHLAATVLTAEVFSGNEASCRVLEKNGYRREPGVQMRPLTDDALRSDREQWVFTLARSAFAEMHEGRVPLEEEVRVVG